MNDRLEAYYERELERLYDEAGDFARRRGKIAARLELGDRGSSDPHVERLLEGFAYVAAGIRQRLDEDFPLLTETVLSSLHPHLTRPRPAMAVMRLKGSPAVAGVAGGYAVPAGSLVSATAVDGTERSFRTCRDARLFPVEVTDAAVTPLPPGLPEMPGVAVPAAAAYVLRLRLAVTAPGVTFGALGMRTLRLYLRAPEFALPQLYSFMHEALGAHVYAHGPEDGKPPENEEGEESPEGQETLLGTARVLPVGFDPDDGMVPYAPPTPWGYRMVADYFSFPEKFHFFDFDCLPPAGAAREITVRVFGRTPPAGLAASAENFRTGCVPVVNLFDRDIHVAMTHETSEYRLAPPADAGAGARVYSVGRVTAIPAEGGKPFEVRPFYPFASTEDGEVFRLERRRGEDAYLSFADARPGRERERWRPAQVSVAAVCCHGADAAPLPPDAEFRLRERQAAVEEVELLSGPTRCVFPPDGRESQWRLMSHLALNHLSLSGGASGASALGEMLRLYDWSGDADNGERIASIRSVEARRRLLRPGEGGVDLADCFLGGLEVEIELRGARIDDVLFAAVLEAFVAGYAALNTPVRVLVKSEQPGGREWRFPLRMGQRRLI